MFNLTINAVPASTIIVGRRATWLDRHAADAVPQLPERCLSRKAGIVRCCLRNLRLNNAPETIESVPCEPLYS